MDYSIIVHLFLFNKCADSSSDAIHALVQCFLSMTTRIGKTSNWRYIFVPCLMSRFCSCSVFHVHILSYCLHIHRLFFLLFVERNCCYSFSFGLFAFYLHSAHSVRVPRIPTWDGAIDVMVLFLLLFSFFAELNGVQSLFLSNLIGVVCVAATDIVLTNKLSKIKEMRFRRLVWACLGIFVNVRIRLICLSRQKQNRRSALFSNFRVEKELLN